MQLSKKQFQLLLSKWMKSDPDLWRVLRDLQIKILFERLLEEKTFQEMAVGYKSSPQKVKLIFLAVLLKIEKSVSEGMADLLRCIHQEIEAEEQGANPNDTEFQIGRIYLN
jgi:hypothetical protein